MSKCWCGGEADSGRCLASDFHDPRDTGPKGEVRKLYLSGPMSGLPECNYPAFNQYAADLADVGYQVVNPAARAIGSSYRAIMKEDLIAVMYCQGVAVMEGWWNSRGANVEVQVAGILQMPVRPVSEWIDMVLYGEVDRPCRNCGNELAAQGFSICMECLAERV